MTKIINWKAHQKPFERVNGNNSVVQTLTARGAGEWHSGMITYCEQCEDTTNLQLQVMEATQKSYTEADIEVATTANKLTREVCTVAIEKNLVRPNDVIECTFANARLKEIKQGYIRKQNNADNTIMSTLVTTPQKLGVCVDDPLRIRKLTPLECWRLMGFDDEDFYKAEKVNSNTQLYKQAGNSIVVDVLEYLFKEIMEVLDMKRVEDKVVVYECNDLINLEALKEKEPELYEELLADYPCENGTYIFRHQTA